MTLSEKLRALADACDSGALPMACNDYPWVWRAFVDAINAAYGRLEKANLEQN